jgi:GntR family transcriptional regulator
MPPLLQLSIDRHSELPLATQLAWKLRTLVATGLLGRGDRLPGVRELAQAAGVNVNTVRSVYGRLEEEGLLASHHGRGTFVADQAGVREQLARIAAAAAAEARGAGLDPREVAAALFVDGGLAEPSPSGGGATPAGSRGDDRAHRRDLRAEIARLEGELAYLQGLGPEPPGPRRREAAHLPAAAELEATRDELLERLALVREDREQARRDAAEHRREASQPAREQADSRVWRHGGVWTGALKPSGVVYES